MNSLINNRFKVWEREKGRCMTFDIPTIAVQYSTYLVCETYFIDGSYLSAPHRKDSQHETL
jgi:hypothetical protein